MLVDTRRAEISEPYACDVCIIGAGAAGMAIALELADAPHLSVVVLDAGGLVYDRAAQELYRGDHEGDRHAPVIRGRYAGLGGTTRVWAGWCRPLDRDDLERWPLTPDELAPYYQRAGAVCGVGSSSSFELSGWEQAVRGRPLIESEQVCHPVFLVSPTDFAKRYASRLARAEHVRVMLHAPVMRLRPTGGGRTVDVEFATGRGARARLSPRLTVLAAGGLENPRLLLLSGDSPENAPGNRHDVVGRYFTEHGFADPGWFVPADPREDLRFYFPARDPASGSFAVRPVLSLTPHARSAEKLLNAALYFYPAYESHPTFAHESVKAALELWAMAGNKAVPADRGPLLRQALRSPARLLHALLRKQLVRGPQKRWRLRMYYECLPDPGNRVVLTDRKDAFGRPRLKLEWRLRAPDLDSADRFARRLDGLIRARGKGRLTLPHDAEHWRAVTESGKHPMGTTRMCDDPTRGVVDRDCRVHGVDNLFVAGSSVFPTVGYANPTLTLVALAIRLADHLKRRLRESPGPTVAPRGEDCSTIEEEVEP